MTYYITCVKEKFLLKAEYTLPVWKKLCLTIWNQDEKKPRTFIEMCDQIGFHPSVDSEGNIIKLGWTGEKNGYIVDEFLADIAEFVEDGSFFRFIDEEGLIMLRKFQNKTVVARSQLFEDV